MDGWIKVHRQLLENRLWLGEPFSRGQAWIDLLLLANHDYSYFFKRGNRVEVFRGQVGRSEVELSDRWHWSRTKIRSFLNMLEKEQQIIQQKSSVTLIVTIVNYEKYQEKEQQTGQQKNIRKTSEKHIQECKEEKEGKEIITLHDFYPFSEFWKDYGKSADKVECEKKFSKLTPEEKRLIKINLPKYLATVREKKYQKNPLTYINQKSWNDFDESIQNVKTPELNFSSGGGGFDFSFKPKNN